MSAPIQEKRRTDRKKRKHEKTGKAVCKCGDKPSAPLFLSLTQRIDLDGIPADTSRQETVEEELLISEEIPEVNTQEPEAEVHETPEPITQEEVTEQAPVAVQEVPEPEIQQDITEDSITIAQESTVTPGFPWFIMIAISMIALISVMAWRKK